jgi:outer membrane protein OmpA-like peptidoglycan-associated protein
MAVCIAGGPALAANQASKQETIGVGMGATVGALAGGPVGFILGAAIGAKIGDEFHRKDVQLMGLDSSLKSSRSRVVELERNVDSLNAGIDRLNSDLTRLRASSRPELLSLLQAGIEMDLLFRTDEYELPDSTREKLADLSVSLAAMPDVHVHVDGFTDERGDSAYNQVLSVQRADFVRQILEENGIAAERIGLTAHGESPAADGTADSYALERRVSLTLFVEDPQSLAANPE